MSCLHTINQSMFTTSDVEKYITRANGGDAILFLEDGAYNTLSDSPIADLIKMSATTNIAFYVIENDLSARGLSPKCLSCIKPIEFSEFVQLATRHEKVISWY